MHIYFIISLPLAILRGESTRATYSDLRKYDIENGSETSSRLHGVRFVTKRSLLGSQAYQGKPSGRLRPTGSSFLRSKGLSRRLPGQLCLSREAFWSVKACKGGSSWAAKALPWEASWSGKAYQWRPPEQPGPSRRGSWAAKAYHGRSPG